MSGTGTLRFRVAAAALAILLCLGIALALLMVAAAIPTRVDHVRTWLLLASLGATIGVFVGPWIAWSSAVDVARTERPARRTVARLAVRAVALGAALIALSGTVATTEYPLQLYPPVTLSSVADAVIVPAAGHLGLAALALVYGLVFFGLPAMAITVPIVAVWTWLVRMLTHRHAAAAR